MEVPEHLNVGAAHGANSEEAGAAGAAAAAAPVAAAAAAAAAALQAKVVEFQAAAKERGIDLSDVDFFTIKSEQLDLLATTRLAAL